MNAEKRAKSNEPVCFFSFDPSLTSTNGRNRLGKHGSMDLKNDVAFSIALKPEIRICSASAGDDAAAVIPTARIPRRCDSSSRLGS